MNNMKKNNKYPIFDNDRFHLCVSAEYDENHNLKESWKLFVKYDGWFNDGSKEIMSSETHTDEELKEFAKKVKTYNIQSATKIVPCIWIVMIILDIVNIIILKSAKLSGFTSGGMVIMLIWVLTNTIINTRNEDAELIYHFVCLKAHVRLAMDGLIEKINEKDRRNNKDS